MMHPTALGINPKYIKEYIEEIAKTCPLENIVLAASGLEFSGVKNVTSYLTMVTGDVMVDAIKRSVPPHPLRPHVNGWLHACAIGCVERENHTRPGRSKAADYVPTGSQEEPEPQRPESPIIIDVDGNESLILFSYQTSLKLYFVD